MTNNKKILLGISCYRVFSRAYFYLPFITIFLYKKGLNIFVISIIMAIYGLSSFLFSTLVKRKVQSVISTKWLLTISEVSKIFGLSLFLIPIHTLYFYIIAQVFLGISYSLGAGEDSKAIQMFLEDVDGEIQARTNSYMFNSLLISGLLGSLLFQLDISLPIYATIICSIVCIIVLFVTLPAEGKYNEPKRGTDHKEKVSIEETKLILSYSFLRGIILSLFTGFLPFYFFVDLNIPTYIFILILTGYTLIGSFSSKKISQLKASALLISNIALLLSLLLFLSDNFISIVLGISFLGLSSGMIRPYVVKEFQKTNNFTSNLENSERIYAIINVLFLVIGGLLYYCYGFYTVLIMSAIIYIIYVTLYFSKGFKHEN